MANAYKPFQADKVQRNIGTLAKFMNGQPVGKVGLFSRVIGDDLAGEIKESMLQRYGRSSQWMRSIDYEATGKEVYIYTDKGIAPHGAMMEAGGVIRAFRSKFMRNGEHLLFIPLVPDVRPAEWRNLTFGVDYVLAPSVKRKGKFMIQNGITRRLRGGGRAPTLPDKLGIAFHRILKF